VSPRGRCSVSGCERTYRAHGYCRTHYSRWTKHGDPQANVPIRDGTADNIGYHAAHDRVRAARGSASLYPCAWSGCESPASDWAYDGMDPSEKRGIEHKTELKYSTDPSHYIAMCKTHHIRFDAPTHCTRGHEMTAENSMPRRDGWRRCRTCARERQRIQIGKKERITQ
jgi:hypothetical protein